MNDMPETSAHEDAQRPSVTGRRDGNEMTCYYCHQTHDLRPYGPRGAMVCFGCAMRTPERKAETERNFGAQLDASGLIAVIDGTSVGPYPAQHHPGLNAANNPEDSGAAVGRSG